MAMGAGDNWKKTEIPFPWDPKHAMTLFEVVNLIDVFLDPAVPMTRELMALVFFHETAFSNIRQRVDKTKRNPQGLGPGVGFGQMEILNSDKPEFFKGVMGIVANEALFETITGDPHFAIRAHCEYFKAKFKNGARTKRALMAAQAGGGTVNEPLIDKIMAAELGLKACLVGASQAAIIDALNACRWYVDRDAHGKPIIVGGKVQVVRRPIPAGGQFQRYWDYTVPKSELMWGIRK